MMTLTDKVILVVGAAAGIGRATAEVCAARGATVIVADQDEAAGAQVAQALGAAFVPVNVTDENSVRQMCHEIGARYGRLNGLIHAAGILQGAYTPLDEFTVEMFRAVVEVNVTGSFLCVKHALPWLRKAERGVVVLISSGAALSGSSSYAYGSSKGGVNGLGQTLINKLAPENIRVNIVMPGNIDTAMKRSVITAEAEQRGLTDTLDQMLADAKLGAPHGVAKVLAWLVSDEADYVRGFITTR